MRGRCCSNELASRDGPTGTRKKLEVSLGRADRVHDDDSDDGYGWSHWSARGRKYNERRVLEQNCCAACSDGYVTYDRSVCDVASSLVRPFEKEDRGRKPPSVVPELFSCLRKQPKILEGCWNSDSD